MLDVLHTCIALVGVVVLIIGFKVNPIITLLLGCLYVGISTGMGVEGTLTVIVTGFGDIMSEVGLLIGFGVLIGTILSAMGAVQGFAEMLLRIFGPRRFPYAMSVGFTSILPSIFGEVQMVLAAPLVRTVAPQLGRYGLGVASAAQAVGMFCGFVYVVPGLVVVTVAGLVGAPLGSVLVYGFIIGPATAFIAMSIWFLMLRVGLWKPDRDEVRPASAGAAAFEPDTEAVQVSPDGGGGVAVAVRPRILPLPIALLPVGVPLVMIASSSISAAAGVQSASLNWIGNPTLALFIGLIFAYALGRYSLGRRPLEKAFGEGLNTVGQVLLITGVGGSLGAVITTTDLKDVLEGLFSAQAGATIIGALLVTWFVAMLLHLVIGSVSVGAIAAAGIIAPVAGHLDVNPVFIALTICSGAIFAVHVNSNAFWMFASLMRVTTSGALKALTLTSCLVSVVALPMIIAGALLL